MAIPLPMGPAMTTTAQVAPNLAARRTLTVCILDVDAVAAAATKNSLERAGFPVVAASNPQDALEKIRLGSCRVVLADCKLPGLDGTAFLEKAVQKNPGVSVLAMSAAHSVDAAIEAIKHGAYDFLRKPLDFPRLMRTLDELAAQSGKPSPSASISGENWRPLPLSEMRRIHIRRVLETCNGNRVRAARMLGIGRTSLYRFLKTSDKQSAASSAA
jgi:DNA-binding NtrC family response regulator